MPNDKQSIVFLLDVDNTLLDNDRFSEDLDVRLERDFGREGRKRYRTLYAELWDELGYADYLGAVQRFRERFDDDDESSLLQLAGYILEYPFAERVYNATAQVIEHLKTIGTPVILSDGDMVLQPLKIRQSGLWEAVDGRVSVFIHKQYRLDTMQRRWPARHYVMVDDKPLILAAMKSVLGPALTTVFVRQGRHALNQQLGACDPQPDLSVGGIGELRAKERHDFIDAAKASTRSVPVQ